MSNKIDERRKGDRRKVERREPKIAVNIRYDDKDKDLTRSVNLPKRFKRAKTNE